METLNSNNTDNNTGHNSNNKRNKNNKKYNKQNNYNQSNNKQNNYNQSNNKHSNNSKKSICNYYIFNKYKYDDKLNWLKYPINPNSSKNINKKLVIFLDVNGVLADFVRTNYTIRPNMKNFCDEWLNKDDAELFIWTSRQQHNLYALLNDVFSKEQISKFAGIWSQDSCYKVEDPNSSNEDFNIIYTKPNILEHPILKLWNIDDIRFIDDSEEKVSEWPTKMIINGKSNNDDKPKIDSLEFDSELFIYLKSLYDKNYLLETIILNKKKSLLKALVLDNEKSLLKKLTLENEACNDSDKNESVDELVDELVDEVVDDCFDKYLKDINNLSIF